MRHIFIVIALLYTMLAYSQTEYKFVEDYRFENTECIIILKSLTQNGKNVFLKVEVSPKMDMVFLPLPISHESKIVVGNIPFKFIGYSFSNMSNEKIYSDRGYSYVVDNAGEFYVGNWGIEHSKVGKSSYMYIVYEGYIPLGAESFELQDRLAPYIPKNNFFRGTSYYATTICRFQNCKLENPNPCPNIKMNESEIKQLIDQDNDGITGIYEGVGDKDYKLACVKDEGKYYLIFLEYTDSPEWWHLGDLKAWLYETATAGMFRADWITYLKYKNQKVFVVFDGAMMSVNINGKEFQFVKMYPTAKF